jgi:hypothetical protein
MHAAWMLSASRILEFWEGGLGSTGRWNRAPLMDGELRPRPRASCSARSGRMLVGADEDGAQLVELLDFGGGEGAIVDADVVDSAVLVKSLDIPIAPAPSIEWANQTSKKR